MTQRTRSYKPYIDVDIYNHMSQRFRNNVVWIITLEQLKHNARTIYKTIYTSLLTTIQHAPLYFQNIYLSLDLGLVAKKLFYNSTFLGHVM